MTIKPPDARWQITAGRSIGRNWLEWLSDLKKYFDDLTDLISGTANEITVTDDGDGTITISGAGSDTDITVDLSRYCL